MVIILGPLSLHLQTVFRCCWELPGVYCTCARCLPYLWASACWPCGPSCNCVAIGDPDLVTGGVALPGRTCSNARDCSWWACVAVVTGIWTTLGWVAVGRSTAVATVLPRGAAVSADAAAAPGKIPQQSWTEKLSTLMDWLPVGVATYPVARVLGRHALLVPVAMCALVVCVRQPQAVWWQHCDLSAHCLPLAAPPAADWHGSRTPSAVEPAQQQHKWLLVSHIRAAHPSLILASANETPQTCEVIMPPDDEWRPPAIATLCTVLADWTVDTAVCPTA